MLFRSEHYQNATVPIPPLAESGFAALPPFLKQSLGRVRWHWRFDDREKQIRRTKDYWRMIDGVDRGLGTILAALERQADETTVELASLRRELRLLKEEHAAQLATLSSQVAAVQAATEQQAAARTSQVAAR